ncbi:MAG TPA: putative Ig domain-containing protein [Steroidobacteraceae bacterium]|nr:putative Ig domain-containing protein [Steroidobacteraceae bacterium]
MSFVTRYVTLLVLACFLTACGGGGGDSQPPPTTTAPSNLSYPSPQQFTVGQAIAELSPSVSGVVTAYSVSPALPTGLSLNASSGHITGTPQTATAQATYTITASNSGGSTIFALTITVQDAESFWLEPTQATTLGVAQIIQVFAALQKSSDAYPHYVDSASLDYSSSNTNVASIDSEGHVLALSEGTAVISASDGTHSSQLTVTVAGHMDQRSVAVAGQGDRSYWIYVPNFTSGDSHPVIIAMHGGGGSAMLQASMTRLNELAAQEGIYVVYLEGSGLIQTFNAGGCCG